MNRKRLLIVLFLAVISGTLAAYTALQYLESRPPITVISPESQRRSVSVAVAARDLPVGSVVAAEDVRLVRWPEEAVPAGYASSVDEVVGRGLITAVRTNEPMLASKLAERGIGGGLPIVIPEGMRALSVRVDEVIGVAGYVVPGTRVDVLLTITPPGQREPITRVIMQNIQALASNQTHDRDEEGNPIRATVMTLLLTPEQAEKLVLAAAEGRIQLALRNMLDVEEITTTGARTAMLLDGAAPRPRTARAAAPTARQVEATVIETYRGGVRTRVQF